ncbi:MAG: hypothetical protein AB1942_13780 [Pseudomonadota bacterium]
MHVKGEIHPTTQPPRGSAPTAEELAELRDEIDALMALPPRGRPDIIVVGDEVISGIYLPGRGA